MRIKKVKVKINIKLIYLIAFIIVISSCAQNIPGESSDSPYIPYFTKTFTKLDVKSTINHSELNQKNQKKWLFMMYLCGDDSSQSELYKFFRTNMTQAARGLYNTDAEVKVVALYDGLENNDTRIYEIKADGRMSYTISDYAEDITSEAAIFSGLEADTGNYETLSKFLKWTNEKYNSDNSYTTVLVIESHGYGSYGKADAKSCCQDDSSNSYISTDEISKALTDAGFSKSRKLDMIVYDCCLMGTVEEAYEIRNFSKSVVFSPEAVPANGNSYDKIISNIESDTSIEELGINIVSIYANNYYLKNRGYTLTFVDLSAMDEVKNALNSYSDYFNKSENENLLKEPDAKFLLRRPGSSDNMTASQALNYQLQYECLFKKTNTIYYAFDSGYLADKTKAFADSNSNSELSQICVNLQAALEKAIVISWRGTKSGEPFAVSSKLSGVYPSFNSEKNYYGISVSGIKSGSKSNPYWQSLFAFNEDTSWGKMLEKIYIYSK